MLNSSFVNGYELFVQVVEGSTRRFQPVLENSHIAGIAIVLIATTQRIDRESDKFFVLLRGQSTGAGELCVVNRCIDEVSSGDDHVVAAAEETGCRIQKLCLRHRGHLTGVAPRGPQLRLGDPQQMFQSLAGCQIGPLAPGHGLRKLKTVVGAPVVET